MNLSVLYDEFFKELSESSLRALEDEVPGVTVSYSGQLKSAGIADLIDSEIIFGPAPPKMLKELKNLKWHHLASAGAGPFSNRSLYANHEIILTKSSGTFGIPIAEHVIGMMLALSRNFTYYYKNQLDGVWRQNWPKTFDIFGSTVLVLGLGNLGTEVCKRLSGFGCHIIGFRHDSSLPHGFANEVRPMSQFQESLPAADYIIICLPGTDETRNLVGRNEFLLMKDRAIIINVGRGFIIDTGALIDALNNNVIAGAGLDVTEPEPLPLGHPLWNTKNVLLTPHESASSNETAKRRLAIFKDLLKRYASGQPLYNIVDFVTGY